MLVLVLVLVLGVGNKAGLVLVQTAPNTSEKQQTELDPKSCEAQLTFPRKTRFRARRAANRSEPEREASCHNRALSGAISRNRPAAVGSGNGPATPEHRKSLNPTGYWLCLGLGELRTANRPRVQPKGFQVFNKHL